jgi:uncharacterized protein YktA (UPF0223 family)
MSKKKTNEIIKEYAIDYDMFTVEEIVKIVNFFKIIENINKNRRYKKDEVIEKYNEYRNILNNKSLEKQYDKMMEKRSNVSIYQTMKMVLEN